MTEGSAPPVNKRLQQTQAQVDEVVDIMRVNVDKVLERDKKLSELDGRADALQAGASQFEASAGRLKRKFWWRNCKMMIILGTVIGVLAVVIIVWVATDNKFASSVPDSEVTNVTTADGSIAQYQQAAVATPTRGRETLPVWVANKEATGQAASVQPASSALKNDLPPAKAPPPQPLHQQQQPVGSPVASPP